MSEQQPKELITYSRMAMWRACCRRHHIVYELGIRPIKEAIQLVVGTVMHAWLQVWFGNQQLVPVQWVSPTKPIWDTDYRDDLAAEVLAPVERGFAGLDASDPFEAARLRAMVLAYHLRWRRLPQGTTMTVLAVEREFRAPLVNPIDGQVSKSYERGGKIDAIVEIDTQDAEWCGQWIVEHKSHSGPLDPGAAYFAKLRADGQCSDYFIGARSMGFDPRGIIYDVVCKPKLEPLKATPEADRKMTIGQGCRACGGGKDKRGSGADRDSEPDCKMACFQCEGSGWKDAPRYYAGTRLQDETPGEYGLRCFQVIAAEPERYLHRHKVVRLEDEIREHQVDGWYDVRAMHERRKTGIASRNPNACYLYNRPCEYHGVCWGGARLDDNRLFRISKKHPELKEVFE